MSPDSPYTLPEVMRTLQRVSGEMEGIARDLKVNYISRESWQLAREADRAAIKAVEDDIAAINRDRAEDAKFRRQVLFGLAVAILGALGSFGIAVFTVVAGG